MSFGADGPTTIPGSPAVVNGFQFVANAQALLAAMNLHSEGSAIDTVVLTPNPLQPSGSLQTTSTTLAAFAHDGHEAFTLTLEGDGTWAFQLLAPLDNPPPPPGAGENATILDFSTLVDGLDFDGDVTPLAAGSFAVNVVDDVPTTASVAASMSENANATVTLTNHVDFSYGADGPGTVTFDTAHAAFTSDPTGGQLLLPIAAQYTINGSSITINPGTDFQALAAGQTATLDIPYTVTDHDGDTSTNHISVTINGVANVLPPVVTPNLTIVADDATGQFTHTAGQEGTLNHFSIPAAALLAFDSDPQNLPLSISAVSGGATFGNGGTDHNFILVPFTNGDAFTITVSDGVATTDQTFTLSLVSGPVAGTANNDILVENFAAGQNIVGGGGSDVLVINTSGGSNAFGDTQFAPDIGATGGNDLLIANNAVPVGNQMFGGKGNDVLVGGGGPDFLYGDLGADILTGGAGNNVFKYISPSEGGDTITDFNAIGGQADQIQVSAGGFQGGLVNGQALNSTQFQTAPDNNFTAAGERFLFDTANHGLYYSVDGTTGHEVLLATITNHTATASDIHVLA